MLERTIGSASIAIAVAGAAWSVRPHALNVLDNLHSTIDHRLRLLRWRPRNLRALIVIWLSSVGAIIASTFIMLRAGVLAMFLGAALLLLPWAVLRHLFAKRRATIETQMADSMVAFSSAVKAGLSIPMALDILASQSPFPIRHEFQKIFSEYQLGRPLEQCLLHAKERLSSENFALFAAALQVSRESGGRVNDTVERIAHSMRELERLERKVDSETAQARASAFYMSLVPFGVLAAYYFLVDPLNTERLFTTVPGQLLLCTAAVFNIVAFLWARRIGSPDI